MSAYLDVAAFRLRTRMPGADVDALESTDAGWLARQLETESRWVDARLAKRYAVPFADPPPEIVLRWVTTLVTESAFARRGTDATDSQVSQLIIDAAKLARDEITEASDAQGGLFELPLRGDSTTSGIAKGGPLASSSQSPYVWTDEQSAVAIDEDRNGSGSGD